MENTTNANSGLTRKVEKALQTTLNDPELVLALRHLSTFYMDNSQQSRWKLRDQLENKALEVNKQIIDAFSEIEEELEGVNQKIDFMITSCDQMKERISLAKLSSGMAINQAESLFKAEEATKLQETLATSFLAKFQLDHQRQRAILNSDVNQDFFEALERVHQIQDDCKRYLLTSPSRQYRPGIELSEKIEEYLDAAYRKLYRWVINEVKKFTSYADVDIRDHLVLAFESFQDRPILLWYCLLEYAQTRSKAVVDGFIAALTTGGPNGMPRPIDIHAHDPKRYIGDIAAWVHQCLASEQELIKSGLLRQVSKSSFASIHQAQEMASNQNLSSLSKLTNNLSAKSESKGASTADNDGNVMHSETNDSATSENQHLPDVAINPDAVFGDNVSATENPDIYFKQYTSHILDIELSGLSQPLSTRVLHILQSNPNPPLLYHFATLFYYYSHTFSTHVGPQSQITKTFNICREHAYIEFFKALHSKMSALLQTKPMPAPDLSPPHEFTAVVIMMEEIMRIVETSIIPDQDKEYEALPILDRIVEPLIESCILGLQVSNSTLKPGPRGMPVQGNASSVDLITHSLEQTVYLINCHSAIFRVLENHPCCVIKQAHIKSFMDSKINHLVAEQCSIIFRNTGIATKLESLRQFQQLQLQLSQRGDDSNASPSPSPPPSTSKTLSQVPGMDFNSLQQTIRNFEASFLDIGTFSMVQMDKLEDPRIRSQARSATSHTITQVYSVFYDAIHDANSGFDNPDAIMRYKPEQVKLIVAS